jgi:hypothetical protein
VKKDIPREAIEAKLNLAKRELEFAGPIHSRDLRKHICRLERTLKGMKQSERYLFHPAMICDNNRT